MDKDGPAWSAFWDGGYIARLRCDGQGEQRISLPTLQVSSLTFGGGDYGDIDDSLTSQWPADIAKTTGEYGPEGCFGFAVKFAGRRNCSQLWDFIDLRTE